MHLDTTTWVLSISAIIVGVVIILFLFTTTSGVSWLFAAITSALIVVIVVVIIFCLYQDETPPIPSTELRRLQEVYPFMARGSVDAVSNFTPGPLVLASGEVIYLQNILDGSYLVRTEYCEGAPDTIQNAVTWPDFWPWVVNVVGVTSDGFQVITLQSQDLSTSDPANSYLRLCLFDCCGGENNVTVGTSVQATWIVFQLQNQNIVRLTNQTSGLNLGVCYTSSCRTRITSAAAVANVAGLPLGSGCAAAWRVVKT